MYDRRWLLGLGLGAGLAAGAGRALAAKTKTATVSAASSDPRLLPSGGDDTARLQTAIDRAAVRGVPLLIGAGQFRIGRLRLPDGAIIAGVPGRTVLAYDGSGSFLEAEGASRLRISDLVLDGGLKALDRGAGGALLVASGCTDLIFENVKFANSLGDGLMLRMCSGSVRHCRIEVCEGTALQSVDAAGLEIIHNTVRHIGSNGIQVRRSEAGEDGTLIANNRIEKVAARLGGSGQYGNGINVFRAASVVVSGNRITDCAFSAIRNNAGANGQILGNSCERCGEVAIYAEFGATGAVIASNLVDTAAMGISVANFDEDRRLTVIQGNLIRNLFVRPGSPERRGVGIGVEADAVVTGNLIEGAPVAGIMIGWGSYLRDVAVTGNVVRKSGIGIAVSAVAGAGTAMLAQNLISGAGLGAVRAMDHEAPLGEDLVAGGSGAYPNIVVSGCIAT